MGHPEAGHGPGARRRRADHGPGTPGHEDRLLRVLAVEIITVRASRRHHLPYFGLVVAAGRGSRFRGYKQFAPLLGKPVLYYSLAAFERCREVETVVVVVPRGKLGTVSELCCRYRLAKVSVVVEGGKERTDSVRHGLSVLPSTGLVVVHDAARPLLTPTMLSLGFHACERHHAITFGAPATDTLKLVRGSRISQTIDRTSVIHVQTPQFFDLALLRRAHREARGHATDDCTLVEKLGRPVYWLENPDLNPKIATRADLAVCASLLRSRT